MNREMVVNYFTTLRNNAQFKLGFRNLKQRESALNGYKGRMRDYLKLNSDKIILRNSIVAPYREGEKIVAMTRGARFKFRHAWRGFCDVPEGYTGHGFYAMPLGLTGRQVERFIYDSETATEGYSISAEFVVIDGFGKEIWSHSVI